MRIKFTALQCARVLHPSPEQLPSANNDKLRGAPLLFIDRSSNVQPPFPANLNLSTPIDWGEPHESEI